MHIQIINFNLNGITEQQYIDACEQKYAPLFREMPGLISKVWIRNPETNTYGGVYTWKDEASMKAYKQTEIFQSLGANPAFANVTSVEFGVMESATRLSAKKKAA